MVIAENRTFVSASILYRVIIKEAGDLAAENIRVQCIRGGRQTTWIKGFVSMSEALCYHVMYSFSTLKYNGKNRNVQIATRFALLGSYVVHCLSNSSRLNCLNNCMLEVR